jgi:hypothetical protein
MERVFIHAIGRLDLQEGPLYNLSDGGRGSQRIKLTPKKSASSSKNLKDWRSTMTPEEHVAFSSRNVKAWYAAHTTPEIRSARARHAALMQAQQR